MSVYHIPVETKHQILSRVKAGVPVSSVSKEHGISTKTIYRWLSKQSLVSPSLLQLSRLKRENGELLKMVGKLTLELSKLKKREIG